MKDELRRGERGVLKEKNKTKHSFKGKRNIKM